jgi:hypothetical protein
MSTIHQQGEDRPDTGAGSPKPDALVFKRQAVRELPMPEEVARELDDYCRRLGFFWRKHRRQFADDFLLRWHYQGQDVHYLPTPDGPVVVVAGRADSAAYRRVLNGFSREERCRMIFLSIDPWDDPVSRILSLSLDEHG